MMIGPERTDHGPGEPAVAIVGGVHGDEPSGVRAVERLRAAIERGELALQCGVALIVANPAAVEAGVRGVDSDLNRAFPGDPDGDREQRLAARLLEQTGGMRTLSLHATHAEAEPIAILDGSRPGMLEMADELPVPYVVDHRRVAKGSYSSVADVLTLEAGCQGTEAAAVTAEQIALEFLRATDAIDGQTRSVSSQFFALDEPVEKPPSARYELLVENFQLVEEGAPFASVDGSLVHAEVPFYPVLMSAQGYTDVFGFRGHKLGDGLAEATAAIAAEQELSEAAAQRGQSG